LKQRRGNGSGFKETLSAIRSVAAATRAANDVYQSFTRTKNTSTSSMASGGKDQEFSKSQWVKLSKASLKAKLRAFPTNTLIDQSSEIANITAGRLYANAIVSANQSELIAMIDKLYSQNPTSFGAHVGTGGVPAPINSAIELYHLSTEMLVTWKNFHSVGVRFHIYEIHPKRNSTYPPQQAWADGLRETQGHDATGIATNQYPIGTKPTDSEEFKQLWEIDFHREIYLGPGDTHEHRSLYAPHKTINTAAVYNVSEDGTALPVIHGHTRFIMYTAHGAPVVSAVAGNAVTQVSGVGTELQYVTTSSGQLGVMIQRKYRYSMLDFAPGGDIDVTGSLFDTAVYKDREEDGDEVVPDAIV